MKVIIETCLLTDEEKVKVCQIAKEAGADFVKTSTGFSTGGATVADVALMRKTVGPDMGVKASGGVRGPEDAKAMIAAGANRLGTSAGVAIAKGELSISRKRRWHIDGTENESGSFICTKRHQMCGSRRSSY